MLIEDNEDEGEDIRAECGSGAGKPALETGALQLTPRLGLLLLAAQDRRTDSQASLKR
jgi:hypothetical protein